MEDVPILDGYLISYHVLTSFYRIYHGRLPEITPQDSPWNCQAVVEVAEEDATEEVRYCRWMLVVKDTYEDIKYWFVDSKIWWGHHHVSVVNPSWYWICKMWYIPLFFEEGLLLRVNHGRKVKSFISKKVWLRSVCWMYVFLIQSCPIGLVYLLYKFRSKLELQLQIGSWGVSHCRNSKTSGLSPTRDNSNCLYI